MPNTILTANAVGIRQPEPPEGRKLLNLNPPIVFTTGAEVYQFNSLALGNSPFSGILSAWVDASNFADTLFLIFTINNGAQVIKVQGGTQGYVIITAQMPMTITITISAAPAAATALQVILYNYNALFTGSVATAPAIASGSGGGISSGGSGGSGGGSGGLSPSGGRHVL